MHMYTYKVQKQDDENRNSDESVNPSKYFLYEGTIQRLSVDFSISPTPPDILKFEFPIRCNEKKKLEILSGFPTTHRLLRGPRGDSGSGLSASLHLSSSTPYSVSSPNPVWLIPQEAQCS